MLGGNVMIGYREQIAVTEYFDGAARSDVVADVFFGAGQPLRVGSRGKRDRGQRRRYERMVDFLQGL